jgi:hypothetical protein
MLISTAWGVQQPAVHQIQACVIHATQAARDEPLWTRQALPRNARPPSRARSAAAIWLHYAVTSRQWSSLAESPRRTSELRSAIPNAPNIILRNVYGWFTRIEGGLYDLTPEGAIALARWAPKAATPS